MKLLITTILLLTSSMSLATDMICGTEGEELYFEKTGDAVKLGKLELACVNGNDIELGLRKTLARLYAGGPALESVCTANNSKGEEVLVSIVNEKSGFAGPSITAHIFVGDTKKGQLRCEKTKTASAAGGSDFE